MARPMSMSRNTRGPNSRSLSTSKIRGQADEKVALYGLRPVTGLPHSGARVRFRVVREVHWPYWWGTVFVEAAPGAGRQEIATAQPSPHPTEFTSVRRQPDSRSRKKSEASFSFTVQRT